MDADYRLESAGLSGGEGFEVEKGMQGNVGGPESVEFGDGVGWEGGGEGLLETVEVGVLPGEGVLGEEKNGTCFTLRSNVVWCVVLFILL